MVQLVIILLLVSLTDGANLRVSLVNSRAANQSHEVILVWRSQNQHNDNEKDYKYKERELIDQNTITADGKKIDRNAFHHLENRSPNIAQQVKKKTASLKTLLSSLPYCRKIEIVPNSSQNPNTAKSLTQTQSPNLLSHIGSRKRRCGHCVCCKKMIKNGTANKGINESSSTPLRPPIPLSGNTPGGPDNSQPSSTPPRPPPPPAGNSPRRSVNSQLSSTPLRPPLPPADNSPGRSDNKQPSSTQLPPPPPPSRNSPEISDYAEYFMREGRRYRQPEAGAGTRPGRFDSSSSFFAGRKRYHQGAGAGFGAGTGAGFNLPPHLLQHAHYAPHAHHAHHGSGGSGSNDDCCGCGDCGDCCGDCGDCCGDCGLSELCNDCLNDEDCCLMVACLPCQLIPMP